MATAPAAEGAAAAGSPRPAWMGVMREALEQAQAQARAE